MEQNGYVRRPELEAHLKPLREDLTEIKGDVKALLLAHAAERGAREALKDRRARNYGKAALIASLLAAIWWVPAAFGHPL